MSMQLAFYRMHKRCAATYESGATRAYLHGRTECVRVLSNESVAFVKAMSDYGSSDAVKFEALQKALKAHNNYMVDATKGKGVDRHWLGLRVMMQKGEEHPIFKDSSYGMGVNFELSTSNMSPGTAMHALGFGPVTDTGYG